jgi:TM2 domain-containing membrane protein YozV
MNQPQGGGTPGQPPQRPVQPRPMAPGQQRPQMPQQRPVGPGQPRPQMPQQRPMGAGTAPQGYGPPPPQGYGAPPPGYGAPPPGYGAPPGYGYPPGAEGVKSPKSWVAMLLLMIFLSGFGVHSFYAGRIGLGFARLGLFIVLITSYSMFFFSMFSAMEANQEPTIGASFFIAMLCIVANGVWWLIDLILIITGKYKDGNGLPIRNK